MVQSDSARITQLENRGYTLESGFDRLEESVSQLRAEMNRGFDEVNGRLDRMDERFGERLGEMNERYDGLRTDLNEVLEWVRSHP